MLWQKAKSMKANGKYFVQTKTKKPKKPLPMAFAKTRQKDKVTFLGNSLN
jgi:hypothetical protein